MIEITRICKLDFGNLPAAPLLPRNPYRSRRREKDEDDDGKEGEEEKEAQEENAVLLAVEISHQVDVFVVVMDHVNLKGRLALEDHTVDFHRAIRTKNLGGEKD